MKLHCVPSCFSPRCSSTDSLDAIYTKVCIHCFILLFVLLRCLDITEGNLTSLPWQSLWTLQLK